MDLSILGDRAKKEIKQAANQKSLLDLKVKYLGRKGELTKILRSLADKPAAEKKTIGRLANELKQELEDLIYHKNEEIAAGGAVQEKIDLSLPGERILVGHLHPLTLVEKSVRDIFRSLNFSVIEGPEMESEYNNFDALNIPADHPARDMWDTFWVKNQDQAMVMRTHTSPMQIRYMKKNQPPFQIIVPGRVFRYEATDASHEMNFYQFEGLMVGEEISLANFKYIINEFFSRFFGKNLDIRFRPSYFPFVEPGLEVDIKIAGKNEWLEVMGAGMVHPKVFDAVKYDPRTVRGFAFGAGIDRLAMIKYGIPDIRLFYNGDLRFVNQFN